jgi:hypothetical protein
MNTATWTSPMNYTTALFTVPAGTIMWQGGSGGGPKVPPGIYTVKVSMGSWSQTQTFHLGADPRYQPTMTDAEGLAQLKMAQEVGAWCKALYDNLAKIRDAKKQANAIAEKTPAMAPAAKALVDKLLAVEGDMTQLQGQGGQDSLNFPGRFDNQITALYSSIANMERKAGTAVTERYTDLKPQYDQMAERWNSALAQGVTTFNAAATRAGATTIVIK